MRRFKMPVFPWRLLAALTVTCLVYEGCRETGRDFFCPQDGRAFNAQAWREARGEPGFGNPKIFMSGDLAKRVLPGKTEVEVVSLLGPPTLAEAGSYSQFRDWEPMPTQVLTYTLGSWGAYPEGLRLTVLLDNKGRVYQSLVHGYD